MRKNQNTSVFKTPFSPSYWKAAADEFKSLRSLTIAALFMALSMALGMLRIPLGENLHIFLTFFVKMLGAAIYGPLVGAATGALGDIFGYFMMPAGPYFPGYTLSAALGGLIYGLFLYRARISAVRIFASKLMVNVLVNILLGSCWSMAMYGQGYLYYLAKSLIKNIALWPLESVLFILFIRMLLPTLSKWKYLYGNPDGKLYKGRYLFQEEGAAHYVKFTAKLLTGVGLVAFVVLAVIRFTESAVWTDGLLAAWPYALAAVLTPLAMNALYTLGVAAEDIKAVRTMLEKQNAEKSEK